MEMKRGFRLVLVICFVLLLAVSSSCKGNALIIVEHTVADPESKVPNVFITGLNYAPKTQGPFDRVKTFYVTEMDDAGALFEEYGFPEEVKKTYDAGWFQKSSLAAVILFTNPAYGHCVTAMEILEDTIAVSVQKIEPYAHTSLGTFKGILIGIPKEEAPVQAEVKAEIETVLEADASKQ